jgi:hypothetical protein
MIAKLAIPAAYIFSAFMLLTGSDLRAEPPTIKLEVQLLWGTNDDQSPDKNHQPVDPDIKKRLKDLPLKWNNYFLVTRRRFEVPFQATKKEPLSEKCAIEVKNLGNDSIEVMQYGKTGQQLWKGTQALPKGQVLFLGGNAPNATSWLVLLKRIE